MRKSLFSAITKKQHYMRRPAFIPNVYVFIYFLKFIFRRMSSDCIQNATLLSIDWVLPSLDWVKYLLLAKYYHM